MPVTCKIPAGKTKEEYSLYVSGFIKSMYTDSELGTLISIEGTGVAFYSSSNSRRAIVFQELSEDSYSIPLEEGHLPYIKQKVRILYKSKGRRTDLLKFMVYNLEKDYSKEIYKYGTLYWLTLVSYIDSARHKCKGSNSNKRQISLITDIYKSKMERMNGLQ